MTGKRVLLIAAASAAVAGGTAAAIATTSGERESTESAILADAAKRLGVSEEELRGALGAAQDAQIDQAVKDGDLTQKQADAIKKARKESGLVLGPMPHKFGPVPFGRGKFDAGPGKLGIGPHKRLHRGFHPGLAFPMKAGLLGLADDAAMALGLTRAQLLRQLRQGKTLGAIAKAQSKDIDDVRSAIRDGAKKRLDKAVDDQDLTRKQADKMLALLNDHLKKLENFSLRGHFRFHRRGGRPRMMPGAVPVPPPAPMPGVWG